MKTETRQGPTGYFCDDCAEQNRLVIVRLLNQMARLIEEDPGIDAAKALRIAARSYRREP